MIDVPPPPIPPSIPVAMQAVTHGQCIRQMLVPVLDGRPMSDFPPEKMRFAIRFASFYCKQKLKGYQNDKSR